jgi:predicted regulator of Ras-like GTPase activity (Roadblock/LC7/MglB family)
MFKGFLMDLVQSVDGAVGSVIMGMDGIPIQEFCERPETDLQLMGIEVSSILKEMDRASQSMETGALGEFLMVNEKKSVIVRKINGEYFLVLVLNGKRNVGKGRFKMRVMVPRISKEFE